MKDSLWFSVSGSRVLISLHFIFVPLPIKYTEIEKSLKIKIKKCSCFRFWYLLTQPLMATSSSSQRVNSTAQNCLHPANHGETTKLIAGCKSLSLLQPTPTEKYRNKLRNITADLIMQHEPRASLTRWVTVLNGWLEEFNQLLKLTDHALPTF